MPYVIFFRSSGSSQKKLLARHSSRVSTMCFNYLPRRCIIISSCWNIFCWRNDSISIWCFKNPLYHTSSSVVGWLWTFWEDTINSSSNSNQPVVIVIYTRTWLSSIDRFKSRSWQHGCLCMAARHGPVYLLTPPLQKTLKFSIISACILYHQKLYCPWKTFLLTVYVHLVFFGRTCLRNPSEN